MANYFWYYVVFTVVFMSFLMQEISSQHVPCFFIFGDSYVDSGNNNYRNTPAKANYIPYGVDFRYGPTGRFTNGRTITDYISEYIGFKEYIPPFAAAKEFKSGVNYGSGLAGILDETGQTLGERINMNTQLSNHKLTRERLGQSMKSQIKADEHLKKCLYAVNIGSSDYVNNYFLPQFYNTSRKSYPKEFTNNLIGQYFNQMQRLYKYKARKVVLFGLMPLGCVPGKVKEFGKNNTACDDQINKAVLLFNKKLKELVKKLNQKNPKAEFVFINTYDIFNSSPARGYSKQPCCKVSNKGLRLCIRGQDTPPSNKRHISVYWDGFHLTETMYDYISMSSIHRHQQSDAYPKDINELLHR